MGNDQLLGTALTNLAQLHGALGEAEEALDASRHALLVWRRKNNRVGVAKVHWGMGDLLRVKGQPGSAIEAYKSAQKEFAAIGMRGDVAAAGDDFLEIEAGLAARDQVEQRGRSHRAQHLRDPVWQHFGRLEAAAGRQMIRGTGILATIGATAPFVGLFGTVWGIMNSFIGIAKTQTTNLAVVAPGIAEALLATALGLVAAIPAVVIYNVFARSIAGYKAQVSDASAEVLLLVSRDLDHLPTEQRSSQPHMVKVG